MSQFEKLKDKVRTKLWTTWRTALTGLLRLTYRLRDGLEKKLYRAPG